MLSSLFSPPPLLWRYLRFYIFLNVSFFSLLPCSIISSIFFSTCLFLFHISSTLTLPIRLLLLTLYFFLFFFVLIFSFSILRVLSFFFSFLLHLSSFLLFFSFSPFKLLFCLVSSALVHASSSFYRFFSCLLYILSYIMPARSRSSYLPLLRLTSPCFLHTLLPSYSLTHSPSTSTNSLSSTHLTHSLPIHSSTSLLPLYLFTYFSSPTLSLHPLFAFFKRIS